MTLKQVQKLGETYGQVKIDSAKGSFQLTLGEDK